MQIEVPGQHARPCVEEIWVYKIKLRSELARICHDTAPLVRTDAIFSLKFERSRGGRQCGRGI